MITFAMRLEPVVLSTGIKVSLSTGIKGKLSTGIKVSLWHRWILSKFRCIQIFLQTKVLTGKGLFKKCLRGQDTTIIIFW